ncbi:MAG: type VI secretion system protein TssL, long form [Magnetococcus sp. DMHC-1]
MSKLDPNAHPDDDKTIFTPQPGGGRTPGPDDDKTIFTSRSGGGRSPGGERGRGGARPLATSSAGPGIGSIASVEMPYVGPNPLIANAATLLDLTVRMRTCATYGNVAVLRESVIAELGKFEQRISHNAQALTELLRVSHYILSALLDDVILNTPWGATSIWTHQGMVPTFHNEATGGERFFILLEGAKENVDKYLPFLELAHICLSLGFAGRYRLRPDGVQKLAAIRNDIYQIITSRTPPHERNLSPNWRGLDLTFKPLHRVIPPWVVLTVAAVLALLLFSLLSSRLGEQSDAERGELAKLPPIERLPLPTKPPPALAPAQKITAPTPKVDKLRKLLEREIRDKLVEVKETQDEVIVSIRSKNMFDSGSATIRPELFEPLHRIAQSLRDEPYDILVTGHTDNVPIRTLRFPSNYHLSLERSLAVKTELVKQVGTLHRIDVKGLADSKPITDNATPEGRERNRRVEIVLYKKLPSESGS